MRDTVFEIPLLRDQITHSLVPKELRNCILVSKQWNDWFIPALWRTVEFGHQPDISYKGLLPGLLSRYACYIRSITFDDITILNTPLPKLPLLKSFNVPYTTDCEDLLQRFTFRSETLKEINISVCSDNLIYPVRLMNALKKVTSLTRLDLLLFGKFNPRIILDAIISHGRLETLNLWCLGFHIKIESADQIESFQASIYRMEEPRIKNLSLKFRCDSHDSAFKYPLLRRCTQVEKLKLQSLNDRHDLIRVANILKEYGHRHLNILDVDCESTTDMGDFLIELGKMNCQVDINGNRIIKGIQELCVQCYTKEEDDIPQTLSLYFSSTLTQLTMYTMSELDTVMHMLSGLPLLQKFDCGECFGIPVDVDVQSIFNISWSCLDLVDFQIYLNIFDEMRDSSFRYRKEDSIEGKVVDYFFSQLGRLTKLRRLNFGANGCCLNLDNGSLEYLSNLSELSSFDLTEYSNIPTVPSPMEAEWMLDHWPKLESIYFPQALAVDVESSDPNKKRIRNEATDFILGKRPDIDVFVLLGDGTDYYRLRNDDDNASIR